LQFRQKILIFTAKKVGLKTHFFIVMDILSDKLHSLVAPVLQRFGVDFVALELKGSKNHPLVRVIIDQDGGVKLQTCEAISRALSDELDMADVIVGRYRLEVSSPGVDRPLKTMRDFQRNLGRQVSLRYQLGDQTESLEGFIQAVSEAEVAIASGHHTISIPLAAIALAKLKLKW
jgi:ribosome maturation factor RimP